MHLRHLTACLLAAPPILAVTTGPAAASPARPDIGTPTSSTATVGVTLVLRSPHETQLRSYATAVATPGNSRYRHFLTTAELRQRFGAPPAAATRVTTWARSAGIRGA